MFKSRKSEAKNLGNQLSCSKPCRLNENHTFSHSSYTRTRARRMNTKVPAVLFNTLIRNFFSFLQFFREMPSWGLSWLEDQRDLDILHLASLYSRVF
jgi:hypothetical protein